MNELNPALQRFTEWLATPPEDREPQTQKDLAKELGVSEPQLSNWKTELSLYSAKPSEVKALRDHILDEAKKSGTSPQIKKLAWDILNPQNKEIKEAEFTADEYANIASRVVTGLREGHERSGGRCPVCGECKLLRHEARLDTESEHTEDREVATLALPTRPE